AGLNVLFFISYVLKLNFTVYFQNVLFLGKLTIDSKDSFIVRLFTDEYRNNDKEIIQISCDKNDCSAKQILFKETFDGKNYVRLKAREQALQLRYDWKSFYDTLINNHLLTLPDNTNNSDCFNEAKDGTIYSIQVINYSGQRHYTYVNPEFYDSSCISGLYFNNIVRMFKSLENK
ncbi:hypothetical protein, partial [Parafilimonas terrae]